MLKKRSLVYLLCFFINSFFLKAETFNEDTTLEYGKSHVWNDLFISVKAENLEKGTTIKFRKNTVSVRASGGSFDNMTFNGGCIPIGGGGCGGIILDMEETVFNANSSTQQGDGIKLANKVFFNIKKNSTFSGIKLLALEGEKTTLNLKVTDSNFYIHQIDFTDGFNGSGSLGQFLIENEDRETGKETIIHGIRDETGRNIAINIGEYGHFTGVNLKNAMLVIQGDILAGSGIGELVLENSSFIFRGIDIKTVDNRIVLKNNSIFKADPLSSEDKEIRNLYVRGGAYIDLENSEMDWHNITLNTTTTAAFRVMAKKSKFKIKDLDYFDTLVEGQDKYRLDVNIEGTQESKIEIENINLNGDWCGDRSAGVCDNSAFKIEGDGTSTYKIKSLNLDNNNVQILLLDKNITIETLNYGNDNLVLNGSGGKNGVVTFGTINMTPKVGNSGNFILDTFKISTGAINFIGMSDVNLNMTDSSGNLGAITCVDGCSNINFEGNGSSNFTVGSINSNIDSSSSGVARFNNIILNIVNEFNYSGSLLELNSSNISVGALKGSFDVININSGSELSLGSGSNIIMNNNGAITIDSGSILNFNGEYILQDGNGKVINNGVVNVNQSNNFNEITNNGSIYFRGQNNNITNLVNSGDSHFYNNSSISTLSSNGGSLNFYDKTHIGTLDLRNSKINLTINSKKDYGSIYIDEILNLELDNAPKPDDNYAGINIFFTDTTIFKPGRYNRFDLIFSKKPTGLSEVDFEESFRILPPWIKADCTNPEDDAILVPICKEEVLDADGNPTGEEIIHTNIVRLTEYKKILEGIPGYSNDFEAMSVAGSIDDIINIEDVRSSLVDIVNSLDFNSGCDGNDTIMSGHNGVDLTPENAPCIITLGDNIKKLKAINNSVFLMNSHSNMLNAQEAFFDHNKEYQGHKNYDVWFKSNINYGILQNRNFVVGYNKISNTAQIGITGQIVKGLNGTVGVGVVGGILNGKNNRYTSKEVGANAGVSITYNKALKRGTDIYFGGALLYGVNYYHNERNIDFLDNKYSMNRDTKSVSNVFTNEIMAKIETGVIFEYEVDISSSDTLKESKFYINPNVSMLQAKIIGNPYTESGSSASLDVSGFNNNITEFSVGIDIYQEILMEKFLKQEYAFWTPRVSLNLIKRVYNEVTTNYKFLDHSDDYMIISNQSFYDAPMIAQTRFAVDFVKGKVGLKLGYKVEWAFESYIDNSVSATLKYSLN